MLPYLVIFCFLFLLSLFSLYKRLHNYYAYFVVLILFLFGSLRYKIGMDYVSYENLFDSIDNVPLSYAKALTFFVEPGYAILISYIQFLGFDKILVFAIHLLISLYFTNKSIAKYSNNVYISWLVLFGVYYANLFFNGIRQGVFIALIFYYLPILLDGSKRNIFLMFLMTLILSFILHKTALVLPVIYFLCLYNPKIQYKWFILVVSIIWAFTSLGNMMFQLTGMSFFKESAYFSVIDVYAKNELFGREIKFFSITVLHRLVILIFALYFSTFNSADLVFKKLTNIYFWGIVIYFFLAPLGYLMATRINMNFKIFDVILIPYFLVFLKEFAFKILGLFIVAVWSFAVMLSNFYIPGNYKFYVPYRSIFNKKSY